MLGDFNSQAIAHIAWFFDLQTFKATSRFMEVALTVSHTKKKTIEKTEFTKGELIQAHGHDEAMQFIERGKYKAIKDDDGDTVYIKTKRKFTEEGAIEAKKTLNRIDTCTDKKLIQKTTVYITIAFSKIVFFSPNLFFKNSCSKIVCPKSIFSPK